MWYLHRGVVVGRRWNSWLRSNQKQTFGGTGRTHFIFCPYGRGVDHARSLALQSMPKAEVWASAFAPASEWRRFRQRLARVNSPSQPNPATRSFVFDPKRDSSFPDPGDAMLRDGRPALHSDRRIVGNAACPGTIEP